MSATALTNLAALYGNTNSGATKCCDSKTKVDKWGDVVCAKCGRSIFSPAVR